MTESQEHLSNVLKHMAVGRFDDTGAVSLLYPCAEKADAAKEGVYNRIKDG